jgi:hypothetical protein
VPIFGTLIKKYMETLKRVFLFIIRFLSIVGMIISIYSGSVRFDDSGTWVYFWSCLIIFILSFCEWGQETSSYSHDPMENKLKRYNLEGEVIGYQDRE